FAAGMLLPACNILGGVAFVVHGPPKAPAMYELQDRPTVVFVDDRNNTIPQRSDLIRRRVADRVSEQLMTKNVITVTIEPQDALAAAKLTDRYSEVMSIDGIASTVGAEQIIYIEMLSFEATPDGYTPRPRAACAVKVWDAVEHVKLFPSPDAPETAHVMQVDTLPLSTDLYQSRSSLVQVYQVLAEEMGVRIAKLFYEHEIRELGSQSDPMRQYQ
ncbi:MAG: hypothetical protein ACYTJ0_07240, partial [Planctomycetota bacterium]